MWSDAADFRDGWTCRYTTSGARIRAIPEDLAEGIQRDLSACWIAATDTGAYFSADEATNRFVAMCRKVFQRGRMPFVSPELEAALLESADVPSRLINSGGRIVVDHADLPLEGLEESIGWGRPSEIDPRLELGSQEERTAAEWLAENDDLFRCLFAQAPLELLATGLGNPQRGSRRLDFLISSPRGPVAIEIDGQQHRDDPTDQDRDAVMLAAGVKTIRIPADWFHGQLRPREALSEFLPGSSGWHRLIHVPVQSQRLVTALLEGVQRGFLAGADWSIEVVDPTGLATMCVGSNLNLMAAIGQLWGPGLMPDRVQFIVAGERQTWQRAGLGYVPVDDEPLTVDMVANLDLGRGALARLPETDGTPTILIRDAPLPVDVLEPPAPSLLRSSPAGHPDEWEEPLLVVLNSVFGLDGFRNGQLEAIKEGLSGRDCVVLLPTGAGKSLIYQMVGLLLPGRTLIVDPLVSLMEDQVRSLRAQSIDRVLALSAFTIERGDREAALELVQSGDALFVFMSPERLQSPDFRSSLRQLAATTLINLAVIDEAHCVSEWGHDFRTAYLNVGRTLRTFGQDSQGSPPPLLALTGTASRAVLKDVLNDLEISQSSPNTLIKPRSFDRPELRFDIQVTTPDMASATLQGALRAIPSNFGQSTATFYSPKSRRPHPGLIFVPHINGSSGVTTVANLVQQVTGVQPLVYSGTPPRGADARSWEVSKRANTRRFMCDDVSVMVTTKAFGMGIDKSNIRFVIHFGIPGSIESYYQEVGRAGRDRNEARCILICSEQDAQRTNRLLGDTSPLEDIQDHVSNRGRGSSNQDDIDRQLWFFTNSFKGVAAEVAAVLGVLDDLEPFDSTHACRLAFGDEKQDIEQSLHRLAILGVVRDYTVDWGSKRFEVIVNESTPGTIAERVGDFVERSQPGRGQQVRERMAPALRGKTRDALELGTQVLTEFIYDTVAQARRRSLREMVLAAREARGNEAEFRKRILDYLQEGEVAPRIEAMVDASTFTLSSWIEAIAGVGSEDEAQEWRGTTARLLTSYPEQPGLLIGRGYAEFLISDGDRDEAQRNISAGLRSALANYGVSRVDVSRAVEALVRDQLRRGSAAGALALVLGGKSVMDEDSSADLVQAIREHSPELPALAVIELTPALLSLRDKLDELMFGEE